MNTDLAVVLFLLAAAIAMFALNKPRMDAVALLMLTVMPLTGVISMGDALAGFSDSSIVLLGALFVIGEGLVRTGVAQRLGDWLLQKAGSSETRLLVLLMAALALMGLLGCIDLDSAYRSIHWKSLILIVGMLPFSIALQNTGGVELAADGLDGGSMS